MSEKKPYSNRRWHEPLKPIAVGHREIREDEQEKIDKGMEEMLRYFGVLKPGEKFHREDFPTVGKDEK